MTAPDESEYGVPDDENPEWSEEMSIWSVRAQDFGGDIHAVHDFLTRRAEILRAAAALGISKAVFLPLAPALPGFEDRVATAFAPFLKSTKHAAE